MAESLLVKIDLRQLQHNLTAAGDPVTEAETVEFLLRSGFVRHSEPGWWRCEPIQFDGLDHSEILAWKRA